MDDCIDCNKSKPHFYGADLRKQCYYICYWCGTLLRNNRRNRREHGQKCREKISVKDICHCNKICVSCLETNPHFVQYHSCGCTYCSDCNFCISFYSTPKYYMVGYCELCTRLGLGQYITSLLRYYKKMKINN